VLWAGTAIARDIIMLLHKHFWGMPYAAGTARLSGGMPAITTANEGCCRSVWAGAAREGYMLFHNDYKGSMLQVELLLFSEAASQTALDIIIIITIIPVNW
jgi:hypothetical protein